MPINEEEPSLNFVRIEDQLIDGVSSIGKCHDDSDLSVDFSELIQTKKSHSHSKRPPTIGENEVFNLNDQLLITDKKDSGEIYRKVVHKGSLEL